MNILSSFSVSKTQKYIIRDTGISLENLNQAMVNGQCGGESAEMFRRKSIDDDDDENSKYPHSGNTTRISNQPGCIKDLR